MSNYHNQYRPTELDMVLGQEHVISALQEYKRKNNWPHAFLFTGSAGTGKTTLSRIIGKELGADKTGIIEVDAAVFNGVETMRSLIGDLQYTNLGESDIKFIILDECFAKGTLVNTPNGEIPIQLIKPGDTVYNMMGSAKVKHTFANKIPLDRVVKVHLDSGKAMICSCDHLFFTDQGWIKAKNLNKQMVMFNFDFWLPNSQNFSRSGWNWTSIENEYQQRYKERAKTVGIGVDYVEVYQRGNNDESFKSVIGDSERNQGFVTLYDLEIDGHPSYYAESCLVHNCHMLSKASWNSLLKVVEEPPAHVYFAFCTTESDKVPNTIQSRCTQFNLKPVNHSDLCSLLEAIVSLENLPIPPQGIDLIARNAFGSPRNALTALNLCGHCTNLDEVRTALEEAEGDADSIELCRLLTGNVAPTWKKAVALLKRMDNKAPESIRLLVVNYVAKALISTTSEATAIKYLAILDAFSKPCNPSEKMAPILLAIGTLLLSNPE